MNKPFNYFQHWKEFKEKTINGTLTLEKYDEACSKADWFYYMSDMNLSPLEMNTLKECADLNDDFKAIYNREHAKRFNNEHFYPANDKERKYAFPYPNIKPAEQN